MGKAGASIPSWQQNKRLMRLVINRFEVSGLVHIGRIIRLLVGRRAQQFPWQIYVHWEDVFNEVLYYHRAGEHVLVLVQPHRDL
jgi:hypothetical protein